MQYGNAKLAIWIDVGMPDGSEEAEFRRRVWIVAWKGHLCLEHRSQLAILRGWDLSILFKGILPRATNLEITAVEIAVRIDHHQSELPPEHILIIVLFVPRVRRDSY